MSLSVVDVIRKKRDGKELTSQDIQFFIDAVVSGKIDECQTGAMLMSIFLRKLNSGEIVSLTKSMIESGSRLTFEKFGKDVLVDKHSTGGVGDKISLVLAPALAVYGLKVPMISGRSLGYTGGTLDKLENIPGFKVNLSLEEMNRCLESVGCFISGASKQFVPADAILYQIRDITATVENEGLIVSSILSKKVAEGIGTLIMDVKFGKGSCFKTIDEARKVAKTLVKTGNDLNVNTRAVVSDMNAPLGKYVGNALEVVESVLCMKNIVHNSVTELTKILGGVVLELKGLASTLEEGKIMIQNTFKDNSALNHFKEMLILQGVARNHAEELCAGNFWKVLQKGRYCTLLRSSKAGFVTEIDALKIGEACWRLGGGRTKADSKIDGSVGVVLVKEIGDKVNENEAWIEVHHSTNELQPLVEDLIQSSLTVEKNLRRKEFVYEIVAPE